MAKDIILDDDNDLLFADGDLVISDSEAQEIKLILEAVKNDFKQFPAIGTNMIEELNGSKSDIEITQKIALNLAMDSKNYNINIKDGNINIT